jgi:hypothetical protein
MLKNFLSVLAGVVSGMALIMIFEPLGMRFYPLPPGTDVHNSEAIKLAMSNMPRGAFLYLLGSYGLASLAGGIVATLLSGREKSSPALITGSVLTFGGIMNLCMLPHPLWFMIVNILEFIPLAYLGYLAIRNRGANELAG